MTSVPKPLKFLRPFYEELGKIRRVWHASMVEERVSLVSGSHQVAGSSDRGLMGGLESLERSLYPYS
jgi:hypothetical protein